jgi:hypothetical protein
MSDFISAGLISGGILGGFKSLGNMAQKRTAQLFDYAFNQQYAARGFSQSQGTTMGGLPTQAADPQLLTQIRAAATGKALPGQPGTGPGGTGPTGGPGTPPGRNGGGDMAQSLATPGLNTPGGPGQPETEEQKQARLAQERQAQNQQYAGWLAAARAGAQVRPDAQPVVGPAGAAGTNPAGLGFVAMPGARNAMAAGALMGVGAGMARALSDVGIGRGMTDPMTARVAQTLPMGTGAEFEAGMDDKFNHGEAQSGVFNAAERYNHANYKFVQAKIAAVDARTYNGNSIGYSDDGQNKLVGDGRGNLRHMRARKGASPEEVAHLVLAGGFTELFKDDSEAFDAARNSAINAGEDAPQGMFERMGAGFMAYSGSTFKQTGRAKERFGKSLFKHAALGSEAYVSGRPGNDYTQYLRTRFGDWSAKDDTWGVHIMTDGDSPESPWNPRYSPATDTVVQAGLPINNPNRAAAANSFVQRLPAWQRRQGIVAVSAYMKQIADNQYSGADEAVRDAAIGRISTQLSNSEVEAAVAIQVESNGADISGPMGVPIVQTVAQISEDPRVKDASTAYLSLRSAMMAQSGGGARRRGNVTIHALLNERGGGGSAPSVMPSVTRPPGNISSPPSSVEYDVDYVVMPGGGGDGGGNLPPQHSSIDVTGPSGDPVVRTDTRVVDGGGRSGGNTANQDVEIEVRGAGSGSAPMMPNYSQGDIGSAVNSAAVNSRPLYIAAQMVIDMYNAGFSDTQIQDQKIAGIANHYYSHGQPHMLNTVSVAARVLGNNDVSVGTVQTIQTMIDAGHNPNQIQRPDVWTAEACMAENLYPTPAQVRRWRLDERYNPYKGSRLPPNYGGGNSNPPPGGRPPRGRN